MEGRRNKNLIWLCKILLFMISCSCNAKITLFVSCLNYSSYILVGLPYVLYINQNIIFVRNQRVLKHLLYLPTHPDQSDSAPVKALWHPLHRPLSYQGPRKLSGNQLFKYMFVLREKGTQSMRSSHTVVLWLFSHTSLVLFFVLVGDLKHSHILCG